MPEAAAHFDGYPRRPEHDVDRPPYARNRPAVNPIAKSPCMERTSKRQFGLRVARALHLHRAPLLIARRRRVSGHRSSIAAHVR